MLRLTTWSWRASSRGISTLQTSALRIRSGNIFCRYQEGSRVSFSSLTKSRSVLPSHQWARNVSSYFARDKEGSGYLLAGLTTLVGATVTGFLSGQFNPYLGYKELEKAETEPINQEDAVVEKVATYDEESEEDRGTALGELPDEEPHAKTASGNPVEAAIAVVLETDKVAEPEGGSNAVADDAPSLTSTYPKPAAESLLIVEEVQTTASLEEASEASEAVTAVVTEKAPEGATEPPAESVTIVVAEPVAEPVGEKKPESVTESTQEPVTELSAKRQNEPLASSVDELRAEPVAQPVSQLDDKPADESLAEPVTETAAELVEESAVKSLSEEPTPVLISEPLSKDVSDSATEPVAEFSDELAAAAEPATEAVAEPVAESIPETVTEPISEPATELVSDVTAENIQESVEEHLAVDATSVKEADVSTVATTETVVTEQQAAQVEDATPLMEESVCTLADARSEELFNTSPEVTTTDALGSTEQANEASVAEIAAIHDEKEAAPSEESVSVSEELNTEENSSDEKPAV